MRNKNYNDKVMSPSEYKSKKNADKMKKKHKGKKK